MQFLGLLSPYYLSFKNRIDSSKGFRHERKQLLIIAAITLVITLCVFFAVSSILRGLEKDAFYQALVPPKLIQLAFSIFFFLVTISSAISAIGHMLVTDRMDLMLQSPISRVRLFSLKAIEVIFEASTMFFVFAAPSALAYLYVLDLDVAFIWRSTLASIPFLLVCNGLGICLALLLAPIVIYVWSRANLLLALIAIFVTYILFSFGESLQAVRFEYGAVSAIAQIIGVADNPNPYWLPSRWASDIITAQFLDPSAPLPLEWQLLIASAGGILLVAFLAFDLRLYSAREAFHSYHSRESRGSSTLETLFHMLGRSKLFNRKHLAMALKDFLLLLRDRAQVISMVLYLGIAASYVVLFTFMRSALNIGPIGMDAWLGALTGMNLLFAGFILTAMMTRLVYPSVSMEGKAMWILLTAPIDRKEILIRKFYSWLPITLFIATTLIVCGALAIYPRPVVVVFSAIIAGTLAIGVTGLAIGAGAIFANFDWESSSQISSGIGTMALLLTSLILVAISTGFGTVVLFLLQVPAAQAKIGLQSSFGLMSVSLFIVIFLNFAGAELALRKGSNALDRLTLS